MATSIAVRTLQIFTGLGAVATTPFATKFANRRINLPFKGDSRKISTAGEYSVKEPEPVKDNKEEAMKKAVEMLGEGESGDKRGCFWMPQLSSIEFFFCFNVDKLNSLFLFHFDRKGGNAWEDKLNRIEEITLQREMNFAKGKRGSMNPRLRAHLAWMHKWRTTFKPNEHCRIASSEMKSNNYTLTCNASGVSGAERKDPWIQNISKNDVHIPEFQDKIKN